MIADKLNAKQKVKPDAIMAPYRRFVALVEDCGPFTYSVSKTAITLKGTRRGFAGVKPKERWLDGYLDLKDGCGTEGNILFTILGKFRRLLL